MDLPDGCNAKPKDRVINSEGKKGKIQSWLVARTEPQS